MNKLTSEEQLILRNKAKSELERLEEIDTDLANRYKCKFGICEIVYKVILSNHQKAKGNNTDQLKITMNQVPYALKYAGYDFDKTLLEKLFGASQKRGAMSAKKLRDALTHRMSAADIQELIDRETELFHDMDAFLEKIRTFD